MSDPIVAIGILATEAAKAIFQYYRLLIWAFVLVVVSFFISVGSFVSLVFISRENPAFIWVVGAAVFFLLISFIGTLASLYVWQVSYRNERSATLIEIDQLKAANEELRQHLADSD